MVGALPPASPQFPPVGHRPNLSPLHAKTDHYPQRSCSTARVPFYFALPGAVFCRFYGDVTFENNRYIAIENDGGTVR